MVRGIYKVRILIVVDFFGWAFDFIARGIQKYSKHDITVRQFTGLNEEQKNQYDTVFFLNSSLIRDVNVKRYCVGLHSDTVSSDGIIKGWENICITKLLYDKFVTLYPDEHIHLIHNGVDLDVFKPRQDFIRQDKFVVGWAGNPTNPVKRFPLLRDLPFHIKATGNWGPQRFKINRDRQHMISFYASIDAYVCVSNSEGMPLPILEAAASGLPIVSTPVGGIPEFLDEEWLVPVDNPIPTMCEKLAILRDDQELRRKVGKANYKKALKDWNWKDMAKQYDKVFQG